jgi:hypothetical protein
VEAYRLPPLLQYPAPIRAEATHAAIPEEVPTARSHSRRRAAAAALEVGLRPSFVRRLALVFALLPVALIHPEVSFLISEMFFVAESWLVVYWFPACLLFG